MTALALSVGMLCACTGEKSPTYQGYVEGEYVHVASPVGGRLERLLVQRGVLKPGDTYAITCGEPMGYPGGTNMLKVCRVG